MAGTLDLGTLHLRFKADKDGLRRELHGAERDVDRSGDRMRRSLTQRAMEWARDIGRRASDAGSAMTRAFGAVAGTAGRLLTSTLNNVGVAVGSLSSAVPLLTLVLLALAVAMALVQPVAFALGGVLGALPALITGGIAAVGALGLGFMGLAEHFKETSRAGGAFVDRARQVALAERRLADAQRDVLAAQRDLNRARKEAAERISDLNRSLTGARLDERDAVAAVEQAEQDLRRAREGGNVRQIDAATRAYERAQHQLDVVRDHVGDLEQEQAETSAKGVEGSDQVQAALERQRKATEAVSDAQYELGRAHRSTGGAAREELTKLSASALAAVATIKSLKGEFEGLRLEVQERLFAGSDVQIRQLWSAWLPTLRERLGSMASMFNRLFHTWATTSRNPEFISNISSAWQSVEKLIERIGTAVAGPGLEAFGKLARAAGPFIERLGELLGGVVEDFAEWIDEADKSGKLQEFFEKAADFFEDVMNLGGDVLGLFGDLFSLWGDSGNGAASLDLFDAIRQGIREFRVWLSDPENRKNLRDFIDGFILLGTVTLDVLTWLITVGIPKTWAAIETLNNAFNAVVDTVDRVRTAVVDRWNRLVGFVNGLPARIRSAASGMWDGVKDAFRAAVNWIIDKWNNLEFRLPSTTFFGQSIGGGALGTPNIPRLAGGGLVRAVPGGRPVLVAEAGRDEIVSPVDQMRRIVAEELARVQAERGTTHIEIPIQIGDEVERVIDVKLDEHDRATVRSVRAGAGRR